jgi:hypothetical protein
MSCKELPLHSPLLGKPLRPAFSLLLAYSVSLAAFLCGSSARSPPYSRDKETEERRQRRFLPLEERSMSWMLCNRT